MNRVIGRIEFVNDPEVTDSKRQRAVLFAFERFAGVRLMGQRVDGVDELAQDGMMLTAELLEVMSRGRINGNTPITREHALLAPKGGRVLCETGGERL